MCNPNADSYKDFASKQLYRQQEQEKKQKNASRVIELNKGILPSLFLAPRVGWAKNAQYQYFMDLGQGFFCIIEGLFTSVQNRQQTFAKLTLKWKKNWQDYCNLFFILNLLGSWTSTNTPFKIFNDFYFLSIFLDFFHQTAKLLSNFIHLCIVFHNYF